MAPWTVITQALRRWLDMQKQEKEVDRRLTRLAESRLADETDGWVKPCHCGGSRRKVSYESAWLSSAASYSTHSSASFSKWSKSLLPDFVSAFLHFLM